MRLEFVCSAALLLAGSGMASADVVLFTDNFDAYAHALNWTGGGNWTVSNGTVDLIGRSSGGVQYFDLLPGNGNYVDLDGSTNNPGRMTTNSVFNFLAGHTYTLSFKLGGSQRGNGTNTADVAVGIGSLFSETFSLGANAGFTTYTRTFTAGVSTAANTSFSFEGTGNGDNMGLLLDNVQLIHVIPLPTSAAMGLAGLVGIGAVRRRFR